MLTLEKAKKALEAAEKKAAELNIKVSVVIVDESGVIIAIHRMDGAVSVSPMFATAKAYTSGTLGLPTGEIAKYAGPDKPYYGVSDLDGGKLTTVTGGLPIVIAGKLSGGIGVGGSYDVTEDLACAQAGVDSIK
ncbi:hypothetical protein A2415_01900 [candidate division WWE3 bacterium RIFOXYC1_FULL_39_7]|uniref:Uncharacterized protein n=2 Tax=Katanobacteria TaxID=422282 RepID=A0A1F4X7Z3_UNCKA|nr:MAG: hypothetical protein A2415_01900 [candidate division WWE3 bacterium RIFOXYC1_FULL_39_7]OGC77804.1 MAG: hypothetical protein A2619_00550 [candidate division WWE3 bacterium RIFOXYD1_FULL_39_9]